MPFRRQDVSAMVVADVSYENKCVFEMLKWLDYKGYLLDKRFCVILRAIVVSLPPEVWKNLVQLWPCVEGNVAYNETFVSLKNS